MMDKSSISQETNTAASVNESVQNNSSSRFKCQLFTQSKV